ncbi:transcriptional regulator [Neisseria lactamica]|uniref:transcriptional regulator n=1 Tax=Neisseria lactamica TaxID=486 RepID=UPI0018645926|nr:transcriptional regulator [Neisseria lactamica]
MPILLDISRDGKGRIDTGSGADDFGFPRYAQNLTRDKTAICPHDACKKIHPEDLNFSKFSESKVYFNEII